MGKELLTELNKFKNLFGGEFKYRDLPENDIYKAILNGDQQSVYESVLNFLKTDESFITVAGSAGTGKTFLTKFLCDVLFQRYAVGLASVTHQAKDVLCSMTGRETTTIHSLLGLGLATNLEEFDINNVIYDKKRLPTISEYEIIFIDECSMVNEDLFTLLAQEAIKHGVKIIFIGDPVQLPPVKEDGSITFSSGNVVKLTKLVRQKPENPLTVLLTAFRSDIDGTQETLDILEGVLDADERFAEHKDWIMNAALEGKAAFQILYDIQEYVNEHGGFKVVKSVKDFGEQATSDFKIMVEDKSYDFVRMLGYMNKTVSGYNRAIRGRIIGDANSKPILEGDLLKAYRTIGGDDNSGPLIRNSSEYIVKSFEESEQTHSIFRRDPNGNKMVEDIIFKVFVAQLVPLRGGAFVNVPIVHNPPRFEDYIKVHNFYYERAKLYREWKSYFAFKDTSLINQDLKRMLKQAGLPERDFDYAYALTTHKSQGSTYRRVYVDMDDIRASFDIAVSIAEKAHGYVTDEDIDRFRIFTNKLAYVACSRAQTICTILMSE